MLHCTFVAIFFCQRRFISFFRLKMLEIKTTFALNTIGFLSFYSLRTILWLNGCCFCPYILWWDWTLCVLSIQTTMIFLKFFFDFFDFFETNWKSLMQLSSVWFSIRYSKSCKFVWICLYFSKYRKQIYFNWLSCQIFFSSKKQKTILIFCCFFPYQTMK